MDDKSEENSGKRSLEEEEEDNIGPSLHDAVKPKKQKILEFERMYLDNLPSTNRYEKSYMHRDTVTHLAVSKTEFIVTASCDGHVKFWKKQALGIEFVKHFRAHLGAITCMSVSSDGNLMSTISGDATLKVFDIINFDMINIIKLGFKPGVSEWMFSAGSRLATVAVSIAEKGVINIYDGKGGGDVIHTIDNLHRETVICMKYNPVLKVMLSADKQGMIEYWSGQENNFKFPKGIVRFEFKTDTDLYDLAMSKTYALSLAISPNGKLFACCTSDRRVKVFHFLTGKKSKVFNEALSTFVELQQSKSQLADMEFGRRIAVERELEKSQRFQLNNCIFDETGHFLLYPTMLGIKVINLHTNKCSKIIGKPENIRILSIAMFQGSITSTTAAVTTDMKASDNPALQEQSPDPTLFCTAYKKGRFYMFSRREPDDSQGSKVERDVFNERPSKDEVLAATQINTEKKVSETAVIHTTLGDIQIKLFAKECPKTVENFCVHSKDGYYNGHIFHRVIKGFMIQTGDPLGIGTGGESIWGGEFEDEFHPSLRHDRPYTLSMANAGPNTNGSQFFITVVPTPWLDNKHTVFGRITSGMEVAHNISLAKIHPKTDKPYDDVSIVNVAIK